MGDPELLLVCGILLAAGIAASLVAGRLRLPGLVLFLGLGMLAGSDGLNIIPFDNYELARTIGVVALCLILFEGGLVAGIADIREVLRPAISLATVGTLITAVATGVIASLLLDFTLLEGLLLGSILAATDSAAIFAVLRGSHLKRRLAKTLEAESGLNDPVAVLLVVGFIRWIEEPGWGVSDMLLLFGSELAIGCAFGVLVGWVALKAFNKMRLDSAGLYPVASLAVIGLAYGLAAGLHGSGFIAVYIAGLILGSKPIPARGAVESFHVGIAWVAQISLFVTLGLLVSPSDLGDVAVEGTLLALASALVARPLAVFISTVFERFSFREKVMLSWAGLRGAIPVVLATFPVLAGVPGSVQFFNIVFFAVLLSTVLQGFTFEPIGRWLGVTGGESAMPARLIESGAIRELGAQIVEYPVRPDDAIVGHPIRDLGLPREAMINVLVRDDNALPVRGSMLIEAGDKLHVLVRNEVSGQPTRWIEHWRKGPIGPSQTETKAAIVRNVAVPFSVRPWREEDGDPHDPKAIEGVDVRLVMRTRRDLPGAVIELTDGRFAATGKILMIGTRRELIRYAGERLRKLDNESDKNWMRQVIGALSS